MDFDEVSYVGPPLDDSANADPEFLARLPEELRFVLARTNGLIAYRGGFHLRGACRAPSWHALRTVWDGSEALHARYPDVQPDDAPFAEDALGDQYLLRDGRVLRLLSETGELEPLEYENVIDFLEAVAAEPDGVLGLAPLARFEAEGGQLRPGQLLSVFPPYCMAGEAAPRSLRAVPAEERLASLAQLAARIRDLPDGAQVRFEVTD